MQEENKIIKNKIKKQNLNMWYWLDFIIMSDEFIGKHSVNVRQLILLNNLMCLCFFSTNDQDISSRFINNRSLIFIISIIYGLFWKRHDIKW